MPSNPPPPPPPNDESLRSHNFPSCPDEASTQSPFERTSPVNGSPRAWSAHIEHDTTTTSTVEAPDTTRSATTSPAPPSVVSSRADAALETNSDQRFSSVSSRSDTASPGPESVVTSITTPAPGPVEMDGFKRSEVEADAMETETVAALDRPGRSASTHAQPQPEDRAQDHQITKEDEYGRVDDDDDDNDMPMAPSMGSGFTNRRMIGSSPSSFLRPGSKFHGTQQSERQVYDVQVEIKHVDMRESFLCGYLRIQGLTEDHPSLTTYFEGEIIGTKYNFFTNHDTWGASNKIDLSHWRKFNAFLPYEKQARKGPVHMRDVAQRENIFMRWKEHFLVPDHRVRSITGASFEGFYYICFNQIKGEVSGIYFHAKSEKFQQLELKHVEDRGCFSAMELR